MLDTDFLSLCFIASLAYGGDIFLACEDSQKFEATGHVNMRNLTRILARGFELNERTHTWLVGVRRIPLNEFVKEVEKTGRVNCDIRNLWRAPVLIRRTYL